jgi:hypothetical protein
MDIEMTEMAAVAVMATGIIEPENLLSMMVSLWPRSCENSALTPPGRPGTRLLTGVLAAIETYHAR